MLDDPVTFLEHEDADVRRLAISVCVASGLTDASIMAVSRRLAVDEDGAARAMAAEALGGSGEAAIPDLDRARTDDDPRVIESIATAYGELRAGSAVPWLVEIATGDGDRSGREAAVAALGAIGDDAALPALLGLVAKAPPQVRRRAVVALTVFDDPAVEPAIRTAARDRNPSVREAAEMVVGRQPT
ncbi:MAG: HEAT repeat domain-containing protein [Acidimicrobiia bacterium]